MQVVIERFKRIKPTQLPNLFFYLLILLLPTQLGKHFWPTFSLVYGIRIDYLAPTLFLTDLLSLALVISWWVAMKKKSRVQIMQMMVLPSLAFLTFLIITISFSASPFETIYKWLKFCEFFLVGLYVAYRGKTVSFLNDWFFILTLSIAVFYSSLLAVAQFTLQHSVGSGFYLLGERSFSPNTPGIAEASMNGVLILRPYATFPHPNVLGGFLAIALPIILAFLVELNGTKQYTREKKPLWLPLLAVVLGFLTLVLSLSRASWLVGVGAILALLVTKRNLASVGMIVIVIIILPWVMPRFSSLGTTDYESISRRSELTQAALRMIVAKPIVGVGLGGFIPALPDFLDRVATYSSLQPVHNIYLLIFSETGTLGFVLFVWFIALTFKQLVLWPKKPNTKQKNQSRPRFSLELMLLIEVLVLGLVDHYFLTIQQTQLLFAIILGVAWNTKIRG